eukprot:4924125-Amphidinium_carterae.1
MFLGDLEHLRNAQRRGDSSNHLSLGVVQQGVLCNASYIQCLLASATNLAHPNRRTKKEVIAPTPPAPHVLRVGMITMKP